MALKSRVQYGCTIKHRKDVANYNMTTSTATNMSGFDINGTMAFCVKTSNSEDKCTLYRLNNFSDGEEKPIEKVVPCKSYGMTYYAQNLYIVNNHNQVVRTSYNMNDTAADFYSIDSLNGEELKPQAITNVSGKKFILMANALNEGTDILCFSECTMNETTKKFIETRRFYVKNTGYTGIQDIYYDLTYGLFIVTNKKVNNNQNYTTSNLILRVDFDRVETKAHSGYDLHYPVAQYYAVASTTKYTQFNIESVAIASKGPHIEKMFVAANVVESDGKSNDGVFYFENVTFSKEDMNTYQFSCSPISTIPALSGTFNGNSYVCNNPGALALVGTTGYCISTNTSANALQDKCSVLLKANDINTDSFTKIAPKAGVFENMGHGNGMTYYDNALYVAAYVKSDFPEIKMHTIVKLSLDGEVLATYNVDGYIGSISHYEGNRFILGNYENDGITSYALNPTFYIGYFEGDSFRVTKTFRVTNPMYTENVRNYLQDIHYDPDFGLFYSVLTSGKGQGLYRILPEQIANASSNEIIMPVEHYTYSASFNEFESCFISNTNNAVEYMFINENVSTGDDSLDKVMNVKFYRS